MRVGSLNGLTLGTLLALAVPAGAFAETILVNSAADTVAAADGNCTLREALANANGDADSTEGDCLAGSGADVIDLPAGHYLLGAPLTVSTPVTFQGPGAGLGTLDAEGLSGVLVIQGSATTVRIEGLTLTRGSGAGAINNLGAALTLSATILSDSAGAPAGALTNWAGSTTIVRSVIRDNDGPTSCGLYSAGAISLLDGSLRIENSTLSGNAGHCAQGAGAVHVGAAADSVAILYSTIANTACTTGSCPALVDAAGPGVVQVRGSLLTHTDTQPDNCSVALTSAGHNLDRDGSCGLADPTDLASADPHIGPLKDNGGTTPTHALLSGSPAIDAIPLDACLIDDDGVPATPDVALDQDQRGQPRPAAADAGACDVGAYEGTYVNNPPHAVCQDVSVVTGAGTCSAAASIDGGSSDPDGDTITSAQTPPGPYAPGANPVTLTVTDPDGASDSCDAFVTVSDTRPPVISCPTTPARSKKGLPHNFGVPATDNCGAPSFTVSAVECFSIKKGKKGAPDVHLPQPCTIEADTSGVHVTLMPKKKSHLLWTVDALDANGNTATRSCENVAK